MSLLTLLLSACGSGGRQAVYPVQGSVLHRGKPAAGARLLFHPQDAAGPDVVRPAATVESDGSFRLSTYLSHDGAPPGRYAVTIDWPSAAKVIDSEHVGPDQLQGKYSDPRTTPLRADVQAMVNQLQPFLLP
jgi:hypothetical protein